MKMNDDISYYQLHTFSCSIPRLLNAFLVPVNSQPFAAILFGSLDYHPTYMPRVDVVKRPQEQHWWGMSEVKGFMGW